MDYFSSNIPSKRNGLSTAVLNIGQESNQSIYTNTLCELLANHTNTPN